MKNLCLLFLFAAALSLGAGYLKIGAPVPEFGKGVWAKNKKCSIAAAVKGEKMTAVLFWKPEHASAVAMQAFSRFGHRSQNKNIAFAAVADGKLQHILKFPLINQLGAIPLLIDTDKVNFKRFLRPENRLPIAILIGKDGKLLWRGTPARLCGQRVQLLVRGLAAFARRQQRPRGTGRRARGVGGISPSGIYGHRRGPGDGRGGQAVGPRRPAVSHSGACRAC